MEYKDYPFTPCLHPQHIVNPYTQNDMVVPCGVCEACVLNRVNKMSYLCSQEEQLNKYCYFVTLTYSDHYIPIAMPYYDELDDSYHFQTICHRHRSDLELSSELDGTDLNYEVASCPTRFYHSDKLHNLLNKIGLNGCVSYPYYRDLQLYIKRIKKEFSKYEKQETVRFYAVSEYGPKRFRVHFHLLLFNNSEKIHQSWQKVIRKNWKFGFVKCSVSRGKVSGYCASYVNSSTSLPSIFACGKLKPKTTHSRYFGFRFSKQEFEKYYSLPTERFISEVRKVRNGVVEVRPLSSFTSAVFPRCKEFFAKPFSLLLRSYTIIDEARREHGEESLINIAQFIASDIVKGLQTPCTDYFINSNINNLRNLKFDEYGKTVYPSLVIQKLEDSIYRELIVSNKFVNFICGADKSKYWSRLEKIIDFYHKKELSSLKNFYLKQDDYLINFPDKKYHICYFYDNFFEFKWYDGIGVKRVIPTRSLRLYCELGGIDESGCFEDKINLEYNQLFSIYKYNVNLKLKDKIKHKELNELNIKYL